ncbi:NYN domain-containing protein [uncultured Paludibaculum sp.]|uniref:NYN domain-containing protein n=1 Tax=uncultured Paludibaculum sp. TaxID=1765020 RepID=UPI002AAC0077|nr:NYN domain-containing protein [uncultured Paludibaculum sp.]
MARVISYIDGFNLYFGLKSKGWERFLWLDVHALSGNLCSPGQDLMETKYFTSRVGAPQEKVKRQNTYLEAMRTVDSVKLFFGRYQMNPFTCRNCTYTQQIPSEKMTDVNIAVELMTDAFQDRFDTALLISADSDLVGPVVAVQRLFPTKRVVVAFPPDRSSANLRRVASAHLQIGRGVIAQSQLPEIVTSIGGYPLERPATWR